MYRESFNPLLHLLHICNKSYRKKTPAVCGSLFNGRTSGVFFFEVALFFSDLDHALDIRLVVR